MAYLIKNLFKSFSLAALFALVGCSEALRNVEERGVSRPDDTKSILQLEALNGPPQGSQSTLAEPDPEIEWETEVRERAVNPDTQFCLGQSPKQSFSARLSTLAKGSIYRGTFLQLSGSPTTNYITDIANPRYDSRRLLQKQLWQLGFRILELKFSSKTGWNPDPDQKPDDRWQNAGFLCETQPLSKALEVLVEKRLWPANQHDRFAMGTSNGAVMLSYAISYFKSPYAKMNRLLLQSPVIYDLLWQCQQLAGTPSRPHDFYLNTRCREPLRYENFLISQSIKSKLNEADCESTLGQDSFLIIGGSRGENPLVYKDEFEGYVQDREAVCPIQTISWDAPNIYEGHAPIVSYYEYHGQVDPFRDFFSKE